MAQSKIHLRSCDRLSTRIPTRQIAALLGLLPIAFASTAFTQNIPMTSIDSVALVRRAVQHRLDSAKAHSPVQYLMRRIDERRDSTKAVVETPDGNVARLVAINDKPLSPDAEKAELDRLDNLANHPELQERRHKNEQRDRFRVTHLLSLLPDALQYQFEEMVSCPSGQCYRLSFTPNAKFNPPDLEANVFRGIAGELWIDQTKEQLTRLDARFISDVDFGFGILGKLNEGGTVLLEQSNFGDNDWEFSGLKIHVTGKALMIKSFSSQVTETATHYSPIPPGLRYRDAISLLKKMDTFRTPYTP